MNIIEVIGTLDKKHRLVLDNPRLLRGRTKVRALILPDALPGGEESAWLAAASANPAFAFLKDSAEDVYTKKDGHPIRHER